jgi:hypothetical protein
MENKFPLLPGRETLIKVVLTAIPTFFITVFKSAEWFISGVDRFRRSFYGKDADQIKGDHCLVNWVGGEGLGFKDIENFSRALQLRWL